MEIVLILAHYSQIKWVWHLLLEGLEVAANVGTALLNLE